MANFRHDSLLMSGKYSWHSGTRGDGDERRCGVDNELGGAQTISVVIGYGRHMWQAELPGDSRLRAEYDNGTGND